MKNDQKEKEVNKVWKTAAYASILQILIPVGTGIVLFLLFLMIFKNRLADGNLVPVSLILAFLCTIIIQLCFKVLLRKKHHR